MLYIGFGLTFTRIFFVLVTAVRRVNAGASVHENAAFSPSWREGSKDGENKKRKNQEREREREREKKSS